MISESSTTVMMTLLEHSLSLSRPKLHGPFLRMAELFLISHLTLLESGSSLPIWEEVMMLDLHDWKFRNLKRDLARWEGLHWPNIKLFLIIFLYLLILVGCLYLGLFVV